MVIEVNYKTEKDAADPNCKFVRTEYFESELMPDKDTIAKKLVSMGKKVAAETISIGEYKKKDAHGMRRSGLQVTKI